MKTHEIHKFINYDSEFFKIIKQLPCLDENGPWVAGGSVWKSIEQIPLTSDIDVFFNSVEQAEEWYRQILSLPYINRVVSEPKSNQYNTSFKYHVHGKNYNKTITIQLISFKMFNNIQELLEGFDFTACQFAFDGRKLYCGDTSFDDLRNREIIFNSVADSVATGIHIEKYINIGFKIPESQRQKYEEIMTKTAKFRQNKSPEPNVISPIISRWMSSSPPTTQARASLASDMADEDAPYPRPVAGDGLNLSQIGRVTIPARPLQTSLYGSIGGVPIVPITPTNPCQEIPISPGVSTREVAASEVEFDSFFSNPSYPPVHTTLSQQIITNQTTDPSNTTCGMATPSVGNTI